MYKKMNILPLNLLRDYRIVIKYYFDPTYRTKYINSAYITHSNDDGITRYIVPIMNTRYGEKCIDYVMPSLLNKLPKNLKNLNSCYLIKNM